MKCEALAEEYARLWSAMELKPSMAKGCDYGAAKILSGRDRYEAVSLKTGVPWHVIGLIHLMEAGARFDRHLHNGDALTRRTVQVPKGRPATGDGPFTWEESAIDALCFDKLDKIVDWSLPRIAYSLESFNGWGYRKYHPEVANPYLWSGCTHYARGKYVQDGKWDPSCVSEQVGAMPVLKRLCVLVPELGLDPPPPVAPVIPPVPITPESYRKAAPVPVQDALKGRTVLGQLVAAGGLALTWMSTAAETLVQTGLDAVSQVTRLEGISRLSPGSKAVGSVVIGLGIALAVFARVDAAKKGRSG